MIKIKYSEHFEIFYFSDFMRRFGDDFKKFVGTPTKDITKKRLTKNTNEKMPKIMTKSIMHKLSEAKHLMRQHS